MRKRQKFTVVKTVNLACSPNIEFGIDEIVERYINNPITSAIVCGGLEPLDSFDDLSRLLYSFRDKTENDFVIYTGYTKHECEEKGYLTQLSNFSNVIIKFGRYIPNSKSHYDEVLGVTLNSDGQYAEKIS